MIQESRAPFFIFRLISCRSLSLVPIIPHSHFLLVSSTPLFKSLFGKSVFVTLRLRGRPGRDDCQSALWDCFGGRIFNVAANSSIKTVPQCTLTTISTRTSAQPQSGQWKRLWMMIMSRASDNEGEIVISLQDTFNASFYSNTYTCILI